MSPIVADLNRVQLLLHDDRGDEAQRRVLSLSDQEWSDWTDFCREGPLPAAPQLPVMLRRLGRASHQLAVLAERKKARA